MSVHYKLNPFYVCLLLVNLLLKTLIEAQRVSTWSKFHVFCSKTREDEWLGRWHDLRLLSDECRSSLCSRLRQEKRWVIKRLTAIADCLFFNGLLHLIGIHPLWICLGWCRQVNYVQLCPGGSMPALIMSKEGTEICSSTRGERRNNPVVTPRVLHVLFCAFRVVSN